MIEKVMEGGRIKEKKLRKEGEREERRENQREEDK